MKKDDQIDCLIENKDFFRKKKDELFVFLDCIFVVYATNSYGIGAKN